MTANKLNNQAQMLMLLNQVTNLENQLGQMRSNPQNQATGMDSNNLLTIMGQLKALQGNVSTPNSGRRGKEFSKNQFANKGRKPFPSNDLNLAGLLASMSGNTIMDRTPCVWVTGIPEEYQDADLLSNIFGNFGNVRRIKFTENKPDGALIEMDDPRSAWKCCACMNKQKLVGQEISVAPTKLDGAWIKKDDSKSKDFRQAKETWRYARESRFLKVCMARLKKITPKIIVSNLPEGKSSDLQKFIIEAGYTVKSIEEGNPRSEDGKKAKTGYTMAVVELASVEEAIDTVGKLHNSWPKKFGTKKNDRFGNARGLVFSFAGPKKEKK